MFPKPRDCNPWVLLFFPFFCFPSPKSLNPSPCIPVCIRLSKTSRGRYIAPWDGVVPQGRRRLYTLLSRSRLRAQTRAQKPLPRRKPLSPNAKIFLFFPITPRKRVHVCARTRARGRKKSPPHCGGIMLNFRKCFPEAHKDFTNTATTTLDYFIIVAIRCPVRIPRKVRAIPTTTLIPI